MPGGPVDRHQRELIPRAVIAGLRDGCRRMLSATFRAAVLAAAGSNRCGIWGWEDRGRGSVIEGNAAATRKGMICGAGAGDGNQA